MTEKMSSIPPIVGLKSNASVDTFYSRIKRRHLIGAALIFLVVLSTALLITVIVQAKNRRQNNNNNANQYCLNQGCLSAATHQLRFMDTTALADRCTDFYKYACGGWEQTHPIQSFDTERTILGDVISRRDADIERLLDSPISRTSPTTWEYKVKTYYTECIDDYARVPDSGKAMVDLIGDPEAVDGWFLFDNSAANASQTSLLKPQIVVTQISHVHGGLGANVVFGLRVRFDDTDPNIKQLEFFPAGLTLEINDYLLNDTVSQTRRSAYRSYILDVLTLLVKDAKINDENLNDRISTVIDDIIGIETALAQAHQKSLNNGDKRISMTLQQMSDKYMFNFVEFMEPELVDPSIVSGITSVYVTNPIYFDEAFAFLSNNNDPIYARCIHNYMRWRLVHTYIEDLAYNYVHAYRVFLNKYYIHTLHSTNEAYCTREVIRRFPLAIHRLYTMNSTKDSNTMETVQKMFDALKNGLKKYINEQATWMTDETTKAIARQKIDALTAAIGYASIASDDARLDEYYTRFAVGEKSHFENAYGYHRFHTWTISNSLLNPSQLDHWDLFETRTSRLFDYIAIFNRLFVITSAMNEPLFNAQWPWAMNMGSLGVLLAQKLFASIDGPEGRIHAANGIRIPDWWSTSTENAYNTSRQCITNYYVRDIQTLPYNINGVQVSVRLAGEPFSPTTLRHIGALRFAYTTLKESDQMKSFKMPGTNLTNEQTFFLAYAQTQCYKREDLLQFVATQLGIYDERTALNAALIHMPEFSDAFQCKPKDNKCF
ncbi:unnamed protein product [Rotaria sordida]|uniref:Uncharacterized protein n=1 Tax=Rotaria sordida TaxID=392033 RepID=A0A819B6B6_9BILA|nr:unnamed protein product [Rotaria sordida]